MSEISIMTPVCVQFTVNWEKFASVKEGKFKNGAIFNSELELYIQAQIGWRKHDGVSMTG